MSFFADAFGGDDAGRDARRQVQHVEGSADSRRRRALADDRMRDQAVVFIFEVRAQFHRGSSSAFYDDVQSR